MDGGKCDVISKLSVDVYVSIALQGDLLTEDVGSSSLIVNAQELGGLVNAKHNGALLRRKGSVAEGALSLTTHAGC